MPNQTGATGLSRRQFLGWSQAALAAIGGFSAFRAQGLVTAEDGAAVDVGFGGKVGEFQSSLNGVPSG